MPRLDQLLAALMIDLVSARQLADAHAQNIAKKYEEDPLLRPMAVPRIRLPEVVIDLPLLIDRLDAPEAEAAPFDAEPAQSGGNRLRAFLDAAEKTLQALSVAQGEVLTVPVRTDAKTLALHVSVSSEDFKAHVSADSLHIVRMKLTLREEV